MWQQMLKMRNNILFHFVLLTPMVFGGGRGFVSPDPNQGQGYVYKQIKYLCVKKICKQRKISFVIKLLQT